MFSLVLLVIPLSIFPKQSVLERTVGLCCLDNLFSGFVQIQLKKSDLSVK